MQSSLKEVIDSLEMHDCAEVTASLVRPNVFYEVKPRNDVEADFCSLVDTLLEKAIDAPRVLGILSVPGHVFRALCAFLL